MTANPDRFAVGRDKPYRDGVSAMAAAIEADQTAAAREKSDADIDTTQSEAARA